MPTAEKTTWTKLSAFPIIFQKPEVKVPTGRLRIMNEGLS